MGEEFFAHHIMGTRLSVLAVVTLRGERDNSSLQDAQDGIVQGADVVPSSGDSVRGSGNNETLLEGPGTLEDPARFA